MPLAILCSGQGSQHDRMFERLAAGAASLPMLERAGAMLGLDLLSGPLDLSPDALAANRTAQLLVAAHALAAHAELAAHGVAAVVHAGYSAGEVAAHGCAGALTPGATLELMAVRAELMDACVRDPQAMIATIGVTLDKAERRAGDAGAFVAIVNGPDHIVVGGARDAIDRYEAAVSAEARHCRRLGVRVASHTPMLSGAAAGFSAAVAAAGWRASAAPVLSGLDGRAIRTAEDAAHHLSRQLHWRLDWARCIESVFEHGATAALEIGPGRTLTRMIEEAHPGAPVRAFEDFGSPAGAARWALRQG